MVFERFQSFVSGITICYKYLQKIKSAEMTEFGLRGNHAMCLFFIHHNQGTLTAAQLCQLCGEDKAAISRALETLSQKGYLYTDGKKYRSQLSLTDEGIQIAKYLDSLIEQWVNTCGQDLTEEERSTFYFALDHISHTLRERVDNS